MKKAKLTQAIREWAENIGCEIIRAKSDKDAGRIGVHILEPTPSELEDALTTAERDGFPMIIIHTFSTWMPGSMKRYPPKHLWVIKDWAGNAPFGERTFKTFDDAEEFLCEYLDREKLDYTENRGEYEIVPKT